MEMTRGPASDATRKYRRVKIETSDQLTLITMLYDGLIRFLTVALAKIKEGGGAYHECTRARDIVHHLMCTLREDNGEISKNLRSLYFYIFKQIVMADMESSASKIEEILPVVHELRSAWAELKPKETDTAIGV